MLCVCQNIRQFQNSLVQKYIKNNQGHRYKGKCQRLAQVQWSKVFWETKTEFVLKKKTKKELISIQYQFSFGLPKHFTQIAIEPALNILEFLKMNDTLKFTYEEESNKYKNIYEYTSTKIIVLMIYTLVETVGNFLWWGIIHYELFGGDPMKRSITNKEINLLFKSHLDQ